MLIMAEAVLNHEGLSADSTTMYVLRRNILQCMLLAGCFWQATCARAAALLYDTALQRFRNANTQYVKEAGLAHALLSRSCCWHCRTPVSVGRDEDDQPYQQHTRCISCECGFAVYCGEKCERMDREIHSRVFCDSRKKTWYLRS